MPGCRLRQFLNGVDGVKMDGYILLNKSSGVTSFQALNPVKRILGTGKVGHTGTLDRFANGLLVVLTGKALKQQEAFTHLDKTYTADLFFGKETATLDPEGDVIAEAAVPEESTIIEAFEAFRGEIMQTPPAYSAIHINGHRASDLMRKGKPPEMKARPVTIYALELRSYQKPIAKITVHCSSGTYIRALARDIGLACHSRAYVAALTRTTIGEYRLEDAVTVDGSTGELPVLPLRSES
jgi:tRNA pseudouridine55 synthase